VAYAQPSPALPRLTHPMAKTGYGKRAVGDEPPHADADFAHLCPRDAEFAVFIDHLDDGYAMGHKVIAAEHPRYGQQASRTSLRSLTEVGHLRWIKEHITVEDNSMRWVTRTYWSRTPRSVEWWTEFARARHGRDVTQNHQPGLARTEAPAPAPQPVSETEKPEKPEQAERAEQPDSAPDSAPAPLPIPLPSPAPLIAYSPGSASQTPVCPCPKPSAECSNPLPPSGCREAPLRPT
jgi:hypothetical protein